MRKRVFLLSFVLIPFVHPVQAFQEQKSEFVNSAEKSESQTDTKSMLSKTDTTRDKSFNSSEGTEVFIPGLGKLGMLPKMDFGLELLYGGKSEKQTTQPLDDLNSSDNLRIRGSLKHNF
ncbi:MAG: hypothetical protein ACKOW3_05465 [Hyphomicrobium sp.]